MKAFTVQKLNFRNYYATKQNFDVHLIDVQSVRRGHVSCVGLRDKSETRRWIDCSRPSRLP